MHTSEGEGWKQRPDEEGIATRLAWRINGLPLSYVRNIDLIKKGLRLYVECIVSISIDNCYKFETKT